MSNIFDAVILGAGPAGLSLALRLKEADWNVLLVDESHVPREKVCGGFLGPENKPLLERFGVYETLLSNGARPISTFVMSAPGSAQVRYPIAFGRDKDFGLGASRFLLGDTLLRKAKQEGVEMRYPVSLERVSPEAGTLKRLELKSKISGDQEEVRTRYLIYAVGAKSTPRAVPGEGYFGIGAIFKKTHLTEGEVALHLADQGHVGFNHFENDRVNVCYFVNDRLAARVQGGPQVLLEKMMRDNSRIHDLLDSAERIGPWSGVWVSLHNKPRFFDGSAFYVGDTVAPVHPIVGGGMTLALHGGFLLGDLLASRSPAQLPVENVARQYENIWRKKFGMKLYLSKWLGAASHNPRIAKPAVNFLAAQANRAEFIFNYYHGTTQMPAFSMA